MSSSPAPGVRPGQSFVQPNSGTWSHGPWAALLVILAVAASGLFVGWFQPRAQVERREGRPQALESYADARALAAQPTGIRP